MKPQIYDGRLPALRCSLAVEQMIAQFASENNIKPAEAHRRILAMGLAKTKPAVQFPIVGIIKGDEIHFREAA